jgi:hypothetical protein
MKFTPVAATALAAIGLLAACGPKGGNAAAPGAAATGSAAPAAAGAAPASGPDVQISVADLPRPRAGRWQNVIDNGDGKPETVTSCLSGKAPTLPRMPPGCTQFTIKRTFLGHFVMDMNCATPRFTVVMHSEATGDFQTNVSQNAVMTMSSPQMAPQTHKIHTEAHWMGPCAPGQKPEDEPEAPGATG